MEHYLERYLTIEDVMAAHAEHGRLNYWMVKKAMGPNWPRAWDDIDLGEAIFLPDETDAR